MKATLYSFVLLQILNCKALQVRFGLRSSCRPRLLEKGSIDCKMVIDDINHESEIAMKNILNKLVKQENEAEIVENLGGLKEPVKPKTLYPSTPTFLDCLKFVIPALGIYISGPLMTLIDAGFVGRSSSLGLAALGPGGSISDSSQQILLFLSIGATNLVASSYATNDEKQIRRTAVTMVLLGTVISSIVALSVFHRAIPLSALYATNKGAAIVPIAAEYIRIRAIGMPAGVVQAISQAVLIGVKDSQNPMVSVVLAAVLNFCGDLLLCSHFRLGVAGAAWATVVSQYFAAGLLIRVLFRKQLFNLGKLFPNSKSGSGELIDEAECKEEWGAVRATALRALTFLPFLFVMLMKMVMHNTAAATAAALGGAEAAAHTALFSIAMICFCFGDIGSSISQAFLPAFAQEQQQQQQQPQGTEKQQFPLPKTFDTTAALPTISKILTVTGVISLTVVCLAVSIVVRVRNSFTRLNLA